MLANKWLDDHTFSNKTWHSISNVPIQSLNKLESLALDIFTHDLSVTPVAWSEWLAHLMSYHRSVACPHPQPISRPSASPHSVIRKVIEEIAEAPASLNHIDLQPVFLGLEQRRKEKFGCDKASSGHSVDVYEIDLDEDGPLREEYLPRRRAHRNMDQRIVPGLHFEHTEKRLDGTYNMDRAVPPPAKWSPAGDEPIMRERNRASGQYVAVQPSLAPQYAIPVPASYDWTSGVAYVPVKPPPMMTGYGFDVGPFPHALSQYVPPYPCDASAVLAHSRSQSQCCYDQDNSQARGHVRSQSYSQYNYRGGNMHLTTNEVGQPSQVDSWPTSNHYGYSASAYRHLFRPHPSVNHQSIWLRAC
ncbi:hypothetical protein SERLADRAFT_460594 [Serpula lacrymans var. lacrymans S7.9]|uniref:Uncharacterized protein n=2 Tax=Serpula lacrymans var. lacrymans TaxID=341189 RepID=F8NM95_SERL9|nr:uncharacterized protein SERLADRAFT_460594 [Serpula lacrymans var. lacrymans S7.9]EGO27345.1 hypothetical protein SERLADRAFT_460594 [Serpula lacrymans var. lacrymans S7.9]